MIVSRVYPGMLHHKRRFSCFSAVRSRRVGMVERGQQRGSRATRR
jgi:hypothetical protein